MKEKNNYIFWFITVLAAFCVLIAISSNFDKLFKTNNNKYFKNITNKVENTLTQILDKQDKTSELIKKASLKSEYTLNNPYVITNPFQINPLSAIIVFKTEEDEVVELYINDLLMTTFESSQVHVIPVYGLCANTNNFITIKATNGKENTIKITTENYNSYVDNLDIKSLKEDKNNYLLLGPINKENNQMRAFDYRGNLIFYLTLDYINSFKFNKGNILLSYNNRLNNNNKDLLLEMDYLGHIVNVKDNNSLEHSYNHTIKGDVYLGDKFNLYEKNSKNYQVVTRIDDLENDNVHTISTEDIEIYLNEAPLYKGDFNFNINGNRIETGLENINREEMSIILVKKNSDKAYVRYLKYGGNIFTPNFVFDRKGSYSLYLKVKDEYYSLNTILEIK